MNIYVSADFDLDTVRYLDFKFRFFLIFYLLYEVV